MPLDIVIFGVIAVVLIFRFLGVLGQNDKNDGRRRRDTFGNYRKSVEESRARREKERARRVERVEKAGTKSAVAQRVSAQVEPEKVSSKKVSSESSSESSSLQDKAFLEGAKAAFAMILEAYAAGDQHNLKALLETEMLARMKEDVEKRQKSEERLEISLLEIVDARIEERTQDERFEQIAVAFTSKQCHLLFDKDNKLIEGDPDDEELLCDLWTFRQNLASQDPTWFLCATRSQSTPKKAVVVRKKVSAKKPRPKVQKAS